LRFREVSKAIVQIRSLLAAGTPALSSRYGDALTELQGCVLVVEDDLPRARELLLISTRAAAKGTLATTLLRYIDWITGEPTEQVTHQDAGTSTRGPALVRILDLCLNAALEFEHLRPTVAANLAAEALRLAAERYGTASPASCLPAVLLAQIAYEQGRLTEAEFLIRTRVATIRVTGVLECVSRASIVLARLALHQGRNSEAFAILRDAEAIGRMRGWPRLTHAARAEHDRILLVTGRRTTLEADTSQHAPGLSSVSHTRRWDLDISPRYSSMQAALTRVTSAPAHLQTEDRYRILISCLRIGATHGLYRLFVDAGAPLLPLLRNLSHYPHLLDDQSFNLGPYISLLLRAAVPMLRAAAPRAARTSGSVTKGCQPLSRRESAILRKIAQGMSNKQIAQSLGIAPETVKSHAKNILLKLGTRTRAQAVAHANSMELS
jgi:ATP/maltotriose-dependent transcriptional regulator MalT